MAENVGSFTERQIDALTKAFHQGASDASLALAKWLDAPMAMAIDSVDQCPLADAIGILEQDDADICAALMEMQGTLTGHMILAFDDASGLAVSEMLLSRAPGSATEWGEVEVSSVLETMNIAGSAYLNGVARNLATRSQADCELIPSPPVFLRDFAESLLESAFMDQATTGRQVVFARTRFQLAGQPLRWTFLLIPSPDAFQILAQLLVNRS